VNFEFIYQVKDQSHTFIKVNNELFFE